MLYTYSDEPGELTMARGENIEPYGDTIYGRRNTDAYGDTPTYDADTIPGGRCAHIGGGVFLKRCRRCDDYMLTYGGPPYVRPFAEHEATHPELLGTIPGHDLAILP